MTNDARIDDFIDKAQPFAKPILIHLRELVHRASPDITEDIKWGMPFFGYKGMLCSIAAFKNHCAFNIFKFKMMQESTMFEEKNKEAMGHLGKITSVADLPPDNMIISYLQEAMKLNETNAKLVKKKDNTGSHLIYPENVNAALEGNKKANDVFEKLSYSHKKEYIEWIAEAKTGTTRNKRVATMIEWLEEGKKRNWKYEKA